MERNVKYLNSWPLLKDKYLSVKIEHFLKGSEKWTWSTISTPSVDEQHDMSRWSARVRLLSQHIYNNENDVNDKKTNFSWFCIRICMLSLIIIKGTVMSWF